MTRGFTGKSLYGVPGAAAEFLVWGSLAHTSADKLSTCSLPYVFLGFLALGVAGSKDAGALNTGTRGASSGDAGAGGPGIGGASSGGAGAEGTTTGVASFGGVGAGCTGTSEARA
ncbi:unnamed protein product [Closterium sp. NIES-53]